MKKTDAGTPVAKPTTSDEDGSPAQPPKLRVGREIAETTWRMAVPVVLFAFIGIFADIKFGSAPWLTLLGVVIGFYFAVVLIKQQIKRSEEN
jgi:Putative F0F1-ATPase subunit Ca2+/Mg2+ transporter